MWAQNLMWMAVERVWVIHKQSHLAFQFVRQARWIIEAPQNLKVLLTSLSFVCFLYRVFGGGFHNIKRFS